MAVLPFALALLALGLAVVALRHYRRSRQLEAELETVRAGMLDSTRLASLGNLVAGLVYEINTPIGALHSNHDVLKRALDRLQVILADEQVDVHELDEVRKVVRALYEIENVNTLAVERVDQLVKSLRSFGRPGGSEVAWSDLHEGIDSTLRIARQHLGRRDVKKTLGKIPLVSCAPSQINQVLLNLVVNAAQATKEEGGVIGIRTQVRDDKWVAVDVADNGHGIAPEVLPKIFDPFFTTKEVGKGTGLGLSISYKIAQEHGGRLEVQSQPGAGTRFTLLLPWQGSASTS